MTLVSALRSARAADAFRIAAVARLDPKSHLRIARLEIPHGAFVSAAMTWPRNAFSETSSLIQRTTTTRSFSQSRYTMFVPAPRKVTLDAGVAGSGLRPVLR